MKSIRSIATATVCASALFITSCAPAGTPIEAGLDGAAAGVVTGAGAGAAIAAGTGGEAGMGALIGAGAGIPIGIAAGVAYRSYQIENIIDQQKETIERNQKDLVTTQRQLDQYRAELDKQNDAIKVRDESEYQYLGPSLGNPYR